MLFAEYRGSNTAPAPSPSSSIASIVTFPPYSLLIIELIVVGIVIYIVEIDPIFCISEIFNLASVPLPITSIVSNIVKPVPPLITSTDVITPLITSGVRIAFVPNFDFL